MPENICEQCAHLKTNTDGDSWCFVPGGNPRGKQTNPGDTCEHWRTSTHHRIACALERIAAISPADCGPQAVA